jgi:hypothetical protein
MAEIQIPLKRKNDMDMLINTYPQINDNIQLRGGCYIFEMKYGSIISYDCRNPHLKGTGRLRGLGYSFDKKRSHYKSAVTTRHIMDAPIGIINNSVRTLYYLSDDEMDLLHSKISNYQRTLNKMIREFPVIQGIESENRYFCTSKLDIIVNVKPNGFELNPTWCKASAVYKAEEELSLIAPDVGWIYYPGRMYFSEVNWKEISKTNYQIARKHIVDAEEDIFKMIDDIIS